MNIVLTIKIKLDGAISDSSFSYNGTSSNVTVSKETSDKQVVCFEGIFDGDLSGTWNLVTDGDKVEGYYYSGWVNGIVSGTLTGGNVDLVGVDGQPVASATVSDQSMTKGIWTYAFDDSDESYGGTWEGTRTE